MSSTHMRDMIPESNELEAFVPRRAMLGDGSAPVQFIQAAYDQGFQGAFIDGEESPYWCKQIARYHRARFLASRAAGDRYVEDVIPASLQGTGKGKRACNWAYVMKVLPNALSGNQDYGNCVAWGVREISNTLVGMAIAAGDVKRIEVRHGTALVYGSRGSNSQGMVLDTAHEVVNTIGQSEEKDYGNGLDLSTEDKDEAAGNKWGRSGPPDALKAAVSGDTIRKVWAFQSLTADLAMDALWNEGCINTGSSYTGQGPADPICRGLKNIGGHDQACLGYDDTDEFRMWYKQTTGKTLTEPVFIMDQSWGADWITLSNWPEQFWGPRPEGAWVLKWSDFNNLCGGRYGEAYGLTGINGFIARRLPDWGGWQCL